MPLPEFTTEVLSITRWLADTFPEAQVLMGTLPEHFTRPSFWLEPPRAQTVAVLPAARERQASVSVVYFGDLDTPDQTPLAMSGRIEDALVQIRHRIPRRDETGTQVGVLACEVVWSAHGGSDTELSLTFRYNRLVPDLQPELQGDTLQQINFRKV